MINTGVEITISTSSTNVREDVGNVTVCAMLNNELEGLQENINISVLFTLIRESTPQETVTETGTFTIDSRQLCFNYMVRDNNTFEDNSILNVMVTSDQPRVMIVNNSGIQINIEDNDGIYTCNRYYRVLHNIIPNL